MKLITRRDLIRNVLNRWDQQYKDGALIYDPLNERRAALTALDLETASREAVDSIIGNSTWTRLECDECGRDVDAVLELGSKAGAEFPVLLCFDCIRIAGKMIS